MTMRTGNFARFVLPMTIGGLLYFCKVAHTEPSAGVHVSAPRQVEIALSVTRTDIAANGKTSEHVLRSTALTIPDDSTASMTLPDERGNWDVEASPHVNGDGRVTLTMSFTWPANDPDHSSEMGPIRLTGTRRMPIGHAARFFVMPDAVSAADKRVLQAAGDPVRAFPAIGKPYSVDCLVTTIRVGKRRG